MGRVHAPLTCYVAPVAMHPPTRPRRVCVVYVCGRATYLLMHNERSYVRVCACVLMCVRAYMRVRVSVHVF